MRAKTVNETLNERRYIPDPRDEEVRYSGIDSDLSKTYNMQGGRILNRKTTKEMAKEQKRQEAIKRLEVDGLIKARFSATPAGVRELEDWAYDNAVDTDYVLRPGDLPTDGTEVDIIVYDDENGLGTKITSALSMDYSKATGDDYYNARPIKIGNWMKLDPLHKLRSRIGEKEEKEVAHDIIGKMD